MSLVQEFKEFAMKGNVVDMAIGVIVGAAFGKVVSSLVSDVITPPLGVILGGVDFTNLKVTIKSAVENSPAVTLNYGQFIQSVFDFTIIAFALFMAIKVMNKIRRKAEEAPVVPAQEKLLAEIRDILKQR